MVLIETLIGTAGRLCAARVVRSVPGLDEAAMNAVRQWEFTPGLRDGVPVPIRMTTAVGFTRHAP
jgi:protein TonB